MWDRIWDFFVDTLIVLFVPLVCSYHAFSSSVFLNVSARDAEGLERAGNTLLAPVQYVLAGKEAFLQQSDGTWKFAQRFDYGNAFWIKITSSILVLPPSLVFGCAVKALSFLHETGRQRHADLLKALQSVQVHSHLATYREMGLPIHDSFEWLAPQGHQRRVGDEKTLAIEKKALSEIIALFNEANIPWWVDCGTCLGAYRYGGVIPWDGDIDIAVLLPDFENVRRVLNRLDRKKYCVQDWSSREHPDSFIKVLIRGSSSLIDIYHFAIHPETKELRYIFSLESNIFFPEWWKIRERRFKVPISFDTVFPLKKAAFDGIEVFVPNNTKRYLQRCYGENLDPVKIYNPLTNEYEKDLAHPYWQMAYVH